MAAFTVSGDAFAWLGNSRITVPATSGLLANDVGTSGILTFQNPSVLGGTVTITDLAGGGFTYEPPPPSAAGVPFTGLDTFTYTAQAPDGRTAQGTVTITVGQVAWFVKNDFVPAAGETPNGRSTTPFTTLAAAAAVSRPGDIIFVHTGNGANTGQSAGITLKTNQRLLGQGVGLPPFDVLPNDPNNALLPVTGVASTAANPAAMPIISDTVTVLINNLPIVGLASGVEVAGVIIDGAGALANMRGMSGTGLTGFNIHDNTIRNVQRAGILLAGATGGTGTIANNTISNLLGPNPENAIDIVTTAAGVNFALTGNTLSNILETGIRVLFPSGTAAATSNTLTNIGTNAGRRGIDVEGAGTITVSGNIVDNTGVAAIARSGIQVNASGTLAASVTGNSVLNAAPADGGIQAQTLLAASLCLRMTGNTTANNLVLDNRATANIPANFRIEGPTQVAFEAANPGNTGIFVYLLNPAAFSFVPVGTCGFAP